MAAPLTMQVPVGRLSWSIRHVFNKSIRQGVMGMVPSQTLCTQSQSDNDGREPSEGGVAGQQQVVSQSVKSVYAQQFNPDLVKQMIEEMDGDMPLPDMIDPFKKKYKRCLLCEKNVDINWKNVRLLSQFVSPYTGRIYGRRVTGLCIPMQKRIAHLIKRSRTLGYMAYMNKDPHYMQDPKLFDPYGPMKK